MIKPLRTQLITIGQQATRGWASVEPEPDGRTGPDDADPADELLPLLIDPTGY